MGIAWITRFFAGRSTNCVSPSFCLQSAGMANLRCESIVCVKFSKKQKSSPEIAIFTPYECLIAPNCPYLPLNYLTNSFLQVFF